MLRVDTAQKSRRLVSPGLQPASKGNWLPRILAVISVAGPLVGVFTAETREMVGVWAIVLMLALMFMKFPVALALALPGAVGLYGLNGIRAFENSMAGIPYAAVAQWSLSVIPMFILMGLLLWSSGLTGKIYVAAGHWMGWMPGGLGVGTNAAGAGLSAISGSTIGTTYALARIGVPEMLKAGYDRRLAVGSVAMAGLSGQLIPPSIFLVIYAGIAEVPVGPQLMAGVIPGLFVAAMFSVMIVVFGLVFPKMIGKGKDGKAPGGPKSTWVDRWRSLGQIWSLPVLIFLIFGGMLSGMLTATEAGAVGALGALLLCWFYQRKNRPFTQILKGTVETVSSTGSIFFMLIGAMILAQLLAVSGLGSGFAKWVTTMDLGRVEFLLVIMVAYLVLGMFMDPLSILLLTIPLLIPTLNSMDISLLWFGVFAVLMAEMAILTPPVGVLSYILHQICQDPEVNQGQKISLTDVFVSIGWFLPMTLLITVSLIFFPGLATWLPEMMAP